MGSEQGTGGIPMETKTILKELREKNNLTQDQMAERVLVTRQAVSRWETGETQPNTDTLRLLSKEFDISINTLLGSPRQLVCQCCGMPLSEDGMISKEPDGVFNEDYCKWCYADGRYTYQTKDELIDFLIGHMPNPDNLSDEDRRGQYSSWLSGLKHWQ
jgi:transcriptional regulator with XRE-family HTH domain